MVFNPHSQGDKGEAGAGSIHSWYQKDPYWLWRKHLKDVFGVGDETLGGSVTGEGCRKCLLFWRNGWSGMRGWGGHSKVGRPAGTHWPLPSTCKYSRNATSTPKTSHVSVFLLGRRKEAEVCTREEGKGKWNAWGSSRQTASRWAQEEKNAGGVSFPGQHHWELEMILLRFQGPGRPRKMVRDCFLYQLLQEWKPQKTPQKVKQPWLGATA